MLNQELKHYPVGSNPLNKQNNMNFISGLIIGIIIATVGISGLANIADQAVDKTKVILKEHIK
jgi:uncharacterized membrane protein YkgB